MMAEEKNLSVPLELSRASADQDARTIPVSFASDKVVDDPWLGPVRLSLDPESVDLEQAAAKGIPVRLMHERGLPMARVEDVRIEGDKLRGLMRFSQNDEAQKLYRDATDGILTDLSVGAAIFAIREESDHIVAIKWTPREVSIVDEGADQSVGINRSKYAAPAAPQQEVQTMTEKTEPGVAQNPPAASQPDQGKNTTAIMELARYANKRAPELGIERLGQDYAAFDKPFEEFRGKVWEMLSERESKQPAVAAPTEIGLSKKESQSFSIVRAANAALTGNWKKAGFELEASREVADQLGREARGFFVPLEVQREMSVGDSSAGGYLVGDDHRGDLFIDSLRASSIAFQAGARMLNGLVGNVSIPKKTTSGTFYWLSEGEDVASSDLALGAVTMAPRTVAGAIPMTRRLLLQSSPDVEMLVREDLVEGAALAIDLAVFEGSGSKEPLGIVNHPDINSITVATDTAPTWAETVAFETAVATANALSGSLGYVSTAAIRGSMKTTVKDAGSGLFVCTDDNMVNGYPLLVSTQLAANRTLFGDWSQAVIGTWGVLDIKPDEATNAASGGLILRVFQDVDVAIRHGQAFAVGT